MLYGTEQGRKIIIDDVISMRLYALYGEEEKLDETPAFIEALSNAKRAMLAQAAMRREIANLVISDDEAKAQYDAAVATEKAARSQYNLAKNGAQSEDRQAAQAAVEAAKASVDQVNSYIDEINLVSPVTGVITEVFPKVGELVGQGSPIMTVTDINDVWFSFNIREDMLEGITMGSKINVKIPALGSQTYQAEVYFINVMASFATWKPTKVSGEFDARTFEVRARPTAPIPNLRAGMSAIVK